MGYCWGEKLGGLLWAACWVLTTIENSMKSMIRGFIRYMSFIKFQLLFMLGSREPCHPAALTFLHAS